MSDRRVNAEEVLKIARSVARRYARRSWWADREELESVAAVGVLEAARTHDPQTGVPFEGYAARAAANHVHDYLWAESSPLSGGGHDPRKNIAGVHRTTITNQGAFAATAARDQGEGADLVPEELSVSHDPGRALDVIRWRLRVRRRVRAIARLTPNGDAAVEVLTRGASALEAAGDRRVAYNATQLLRRKMRDDLTSYRLWASAPGEE